MRDSFVRLGQGFHVDTERLMGQYQQHRPYALATLQQHGCSQAVAWQEVVMKRRPVPKELVVILEKFIAYVASSSGVEQTFSLDRWLAGLRRHPTEDSEFDHLTIACTTASSADVARFVEKA